MAAEVGVEAPIAEAVVKVLYEGVDPREAVENLMTRTLRPE
jgi:glycerol-3-phosphate dehydrogenase